MCRPGSSPAPGTTSRARPPPRSAGPATARSSELQLRWFDHYVKGRPDKALLTDIKPYTYFEQGTGKWVRRNAYVDRDLSATTYRLSGSAAHRRAHRGVQRARSRARRRAAAAGHRSVLPLGQPVDRRHRQRASSRTNPCFTDNGFND